MGSAVSKKQVIKVSGSVESKSTLSYPLSWENVLSIETSKIIGEEPSDVIKRINDTLAIKDTIELQQCLESLSNIHVGKVDTSKHDAIAKYQREVGRKLAETKTTRKICRVIVDIWFEDYRSKERLISLGREIIMMQALSILTSYCDNSPEVAHDVVHETDFLETLKEILQSGPERGKILSLCIINNVAKVDDNVALIRSLNFVSALSSFLVNNNDGIRLMALSALANIINEEESAILQDKHDLMKLLLMVLTSALNNKESHTWQDPVNHTIWTAQETARTVRLLARNDANKQLLVTKGALLPLCVMAKSESVEEQREAVGAICVLAFDEENQKTIIASVNPDIVRMIYELKENSTDAEIKRDADCTLLTLMEQQQTSVKYNDIANTYKERLTIFETPKEKYVHKGPETKKKGHIMISYNKQHREKMIHIMEELQKKKYNVWMDVNDIRRYSFDEMAKAVESAHIVLICISQAYKDSNYCRKEAKYAFKRQKHIVPLLMVNGYDPDGWLGLIVEDIIFYDFSGKYKFELKFQDLVKEIQKLYEEVKDTDSNGTSTVTHGRDSQSPMKVSIADLRQWNSNDMENWIKKHDLPWGEFGKLTGRDLAGLIVMRDKAPEQFYRHLQENVYIKSTSVIDKFVEALDTIK